MSGSAYKIAKDRAYHHGTMLISSQISTLGDVLHVSKVRFCLSHYAGAYILLSRWCLGNYDNPRRRVSSFTSYEFAGIQSSCDARQIPASYGSSLPRGVSSRGARTPVLQAHLCLSAHYCPPGAIRASGRCHKHTIHPR